MIVHLDGAGRLVVSPREGLPIFFFPGAVGEPLAGITRKGKGRVYLSSSSLPGEPDRVQEMMWDGEKLAPGRTSREFGGRISALAFLPRDGRITVAEVRWPGHTTIHFLRESDLWPEGSP